MSFDDAAIVTVWKINHEIHFRLMTTSEAARRMITDNLREKVSNYDYDFNDIK